MVYGTRYSQLSFTKKPSVVRSNSWNRNACVSERLAPYPMYSTLPGLGKYENSQSARSPFVRERSDREKVASSAPLTLLAMVPPLQFDGWEWVALALATPVVLWAGWLFHRAAAL